jgi:uncharacterized protein (DUF58 family)
MSKINKLLEAAETAAGKMQPLTLKVRQVAHTPILGTHGRKRAGMGEAFWQYDEYRPGQHEIKQIAWRQTGKSDSKIFVRQNEWEAAQAAYIWCDNSPGMGFTSDAKTLQTKSDVAQTMTLTLGRLLTEADERVAILGSGKPLSNRINTLVAELDERPEDGDHDAWAKLGHVGRPPLQNSTIIIISDFMEEPDVIMSALKRLASRNTFGHMIQVLDPAEVNLPWDGHVEFEDFHGNNLRLPKSEDMRAAYYDRLQRQQKALTEIADSLGWNFSCHLTSRTIEEGLHPLYEPVDPMLPKFEDGAAINGRRPAAQVQKKPLWKRLPGMRP